MNQYLIAATIITVCTIGAFLLAQYAGVNAAPPTEVPTPVIATDPPAFVVD